MANRVIPAYADTAGRRRAYRDSNDGKQAGDPRKAAAVIVQAVMATEPPLQSAARTGRLRHRGAQVAALRADLATLARHRPAYPTSTDRSRGLRGPRPFHARADHLDPPVGRPAWAAAHAGGGRGRFAR